MSSQSAARLRAAKGEPKSARLELRVAPAAKRLIQRAASVTGLTPGDLAYEGARRVLDEHERMVLTAEDAAVFIKALERPPAPTEDLVTALRRHRELFG